MKIEERSSGGVVILDVEGRMTVDAGRELCVADIARGLIKQGRKQILINLERVSTVDSTGVRDIVEAYVTTTRQNGSLKLLHVPARVREVLTVTRIMTILEAYDAEVEAVASFPTSATT